jgi:hypothetical protein
MITFGNCAGEQWKEAALSRQTVRASVFGATAR